ncbi:methyl-accepting chemotaxis protein [Mycobacterium sp. D16R24]|uniref:methyl-accepting chemotaxis protein n=1 Tax=Mycobacterium sp. D16R24 TaxID=1855656 RepID=UPI00099423E7|nr:methyl-accepting chemotaxis protein [Mycobacterium sp. D16R24]
MRAELDEKPIVRADSLANREFAKMNWSAGFTSRRVAAAIAGVVVATGAVAGLHGLHRTGEGVGAWLVWAAELLILLIALSGGIKLAVWGRQPIISAMFSAVETRVGEPTRAVLAALSLLAGAVGTWWVFRGGYLAWWASATGQSTWSIAMGAGQLLVAVVSGAALFTGGRYLFGLAREALVDAGLAGVRSRRGRAGQQDTRSWHPGLVGVLVAGAVGLIALAAWLAPTLAPVVMGPQLFTAAGAIAVMLAVAVCSNAGLWNGLAGLYRWAAGGSQKAGATAGVVAVLMFSAGGLGLGWFTPATVPQAHAACPPDCGGSPGGNDGPPGGGQLFQPPQMPNQMPDYQGSNSGMPGLDQNNGISIYNQQPARGANASSPSNSGSAQQGLSPGQNADGSWQRAANGEQIPNYQNATPYTQGPGTPNPEYNGGQANPGTNTGSQGGQPNQGVQQPAQQPQQPGQQNSGQQPNRSSDQQKIDDLTRQLQDRQQQAGQDRQRLDDLTKQLQQQKQNKQQQPPKFPSKDKKKDDKDDERDSDQQSGDNDLTALLLGAASTRRRKQDEQQGPDTEALGQDASQAVQGLPGDIQTYVQSGQQIGQSSGQAAQGFGSAAQAGASLASSAQSGAVNPQDAITLVQGAAQGIQGTADAVNAGSQIVKTAQKEADQVAQTVGDVNPQLKPQAEQFTQLNDQASQVTDLVGQGSQLTSQGAGAVNSVSSLGAGGVPADPSESLSGATNSADLVSAVTNSETGEVDTQSLAWLVMDADRQDPARSDAAYQEISSALAERDPGFVDQFNNDLVQEASNFPTVPGTGVAEGVRHAGYKTLVKNPELTVRWEFTRSPWNEGGGFSGPLRQMLESHGIEVDPTIYPKPPGGVGKNSGKTMGQANNINGAEAEHETAKRYQAPGNVVQEQMQVLQNGKRVPVTPGEPYPTGSRRVDVQVDQPNPADPRNAKRIDIESKLGKTNSSNDPESLIRSEAERDGQRLSDNKALRAAGQTLEKVGKVARPIGVVVDAVQLGEAFHADGNRVGEKTVEAGVNLAGGAAGAWAGAEIGASIGSVVPGAGTVVGGIIGGVIGGVAGSGLASKGWSAVKGLFS